jgi:hypothetical protein
MFVNISTAPTTNGLAPASNGTQVTTQDGTEIKGIRSATIKLEVNEPVTATFEVVSASFVGQADACYQVSDPISGELKTVRRIEWADGSVFVDDSAQPCTAKLYPGVDEANYAKLREMVDRVNQQATANGRT